MTPPEKENPAGEGGAPDHVTTTEIEAITTTRGALSQAENTIHCRAAP